MLILCFFTVNCFSSVAVNRAVYIMPKTKWEALGTQYGLKAFAHAVEKGNCKISFELGINRSAACKKKKIYQKNELDAHKKTRETFHSHKANWMQPEAELTDLNSSSQRKWPRLNTVQVCLKATEVEISIEMLDFSGISVCFCCFFFIQKMILALLMKTTLLTCINWLCGQRSVFWYSICEMFMKISFYWTS